MATHGRRIASTAGKVAGYEKIQRNTPESGVGLGDTDEHNLGASENLHMVYGRVGVGIVVVVKYKCWPATDQLGTDPISGVVTLSYQLGSLPLVQGDIFLLDSQTSELSDLIRFAPDGRVYWFSLLTPGDLNPTPADVSQLPPPWMNVVTNGEGSAGADYFAGAGKPGFDPTGTLPNLQYIFLNPVVPEPGSLGLLLVGAGLWSLSRSRRKRR